MYPTNGKTIYSDFAVYHAARQARAEAFAGAFGALFGGIKALVSRLVVEPIKARAKRQRQLEELVGMDDHMLRDLGLSRGGIAYAFENGREADAANTNSPVTKPRAA